MAGLPPEDDDYGLPEPPKRQPKEKTEEELELDAFWGDTDEETEYEDDSGEVGGGVEEKKSRVQALAVDPAGPVLWGVDKGIGMIQSEMNRIRKSNISIKNECDRFVLVNPRWAFKDGKTETNPHYVIRQNDTGEAVFQGHTLKGMLTYQIAEPNSSGKGPKLTPTNYLLVVLCKVLYFRGFEVELFNLKVKPNRKNKVGVKVVKKSLADLSKINDILKVKKGSFWHTHKDALQPCEGVYHTAKPTDAGAPKVVAYFSISDVGEADVKIVLQDDQ